ncbi:MAG TPA: hypothetical protein VM240_08150 [Verrucomicrobiae bacterium]|nr:hypothetical protein [Verrucomicrobiae bacterium]
MKTGNEKKQNAQLESPAKRPYQSPVLSQLGAIGTITAGGGQNKAPDTGKNSV